MINRFHSWFHRPDRGWDPVPSEYSGQYAETVLEHADYNILNELEQWLEGFEGKRVLDLGGGPGHYSVAMAKRGAQVIWHDISKNYMGIALAHAEREGVNIEFSLGYLEDASRFVRIPFDMVFCNLCWYYCMNERGFAKIFYSLLKAGAVGYINSHTSAFETKIRGFRRIQYIMNDYLGWKIGHPYSSHGRIAALLRRYPMEKMYLDYSMKTNDKIIFMKSKSV